MYPEYHYAEFFNHFIHFGRYMVSLAFVFFFLPTRLFGRSSDSLMDNLVAGYMRMCFFMIILGYLLVLLQIFEAITLIFIFIIIIYVRFAFRKGISSFEQIAFTFNIKVYDVLDGVMNLRQSIGNKIMRIRYSLRGELLSRVKKPGMMLFYALCIMVFGISAYLRFYDAFANAAPPLSDAYTVLAWTKSIARRVLFYREGGEVYPRGYDFYIEIIRKFSFIDTLYALKYSGPMSSFFTVISIYFAISRFTGKRYAGLIGSAAYGIFGSFLHGEYERQAAVNSQEFAFLFILPTLYFFFRYLMLRQKRDLWTAFCGVAAAGLVHQLVFAFIGAGMGLMMAYTFLKHPGEYWKPILWMSLAGVASVAISFTPFVLGALMKAPFHKSSVDFLKSMLDNPGFPRLTNWDYAAIIAAVLVGLFLLLKMKRTAFPSGEVFVFLLIAATFCGFYFGEFTRSKVVASRSIEFWGLIQAVSIGMGWVVIIRVLTFIERLEWVQAVSLMLAIAYLGANLHPKPSMPYKLEWNCGIEQYFRISSNFSNGKWIIVSHWHGFAVALGKGFHQYVGSLLKFDPETLEYIPAEGELEVSEWKNYPQNIFIYQQKNIFKVSETNAIYGLEEDKTYRIQEQQKPLLEEWIQKYQSSHDNMTVFYEDENLRVLLIVKPDEEEKKKSWEKLWGWKEGMEL